MSELADLAISSSEGVWTVRLSGEIDLSNTDSLGDSIESLLDNPGHGLVIDLTDIDYLDSAGVRLLFRIARWSGRSGWEMRAVVPAESHVRRILDLAGGTSAIPVDESVSNAVESIRARAGSAGEPPDAT